MNWKNAPDGAEYWDPIEGGWYRSNGDGGGLDIYHDITKTWVKAKGNYDISKFIKSKEKRHQDNISEITNSKKRRYQDDQGDDWIDECSRTLSTEQFRGAMMFTIGKYVRRMGKKDDVKQEVSKIADYAKRWMDYENSQV